MCYVCNSADEYEGDECADPFPAGEKYLKNCTTEGQRQGEDYKYCRKISQTGKHMTTAAYNSTFCIALEQFRMMSSVLKATTQLEYY